VRYAGKLDIAPLITHRFKAKQLAECYERLDGGEQGKKTGFLRHLYMKVNFLPSQARDKHRENSKKARFVEEIVGAVFSWD
jgi:hypothetical protein